MRNAAKRTTQARVLGPSGMGLSDARLLADAQREADAWQARLKAGCTESDRKRPVRTSGCAGTEIAVSHLPPEARAAIETELYGSTDME